MPNKATTRFPARKRLIAAAISACFVNAPAWANPSGAQVVNGTASFNQSGKLLTVNNSNGAIINWNSFSIGANETTRFNQASAASSVLNRVVANDPSVLLGTLSSNGKVWLVNPAGILVGQGAKIDVAGFVASTLNVANQDFLAGRLNFGATPNAGSVQNDGQITTPSGGSVYLVAPSVTNNGIIDAPNGEVILAAGQTVQLLDTGTPGVSVAITGAQGKVTNLGQIVSEAGQIGIAGVLVNNSGTLNASSVVKEGGRIFLRASQRIEIDEAGRILADGTKGGQILAKVEDGGQLSGKLLARGSLSAQGDGTKGSGGFIETSAAKVDLNGVSAKAGGGEWLIDPADFTIAPTEGDITGATLSNNLGSGSVTIESSSGAVNTDGNGDIFVNDSVTWNSANSLTLNAVRDINVNYAISNGGSGGVNLYANATGTGGSIVLNPGASIATNGGNVTLAGDPNGTGFAIGTASNAVGVTINGASISTGAGNIVIKGQGYAAVSNSYGIQLINSASLTTTGGTVTLNGIGGNGTDYNYGVYLYSSSITTGGGTLNITGTGGGTESYNYGIYAYSTTLDTSNYSGDAGGGTMTMNGAGGNGTDYNYGVYLDGGEGAVSITTGGGALNITGTGGSDGTGGSNYGIYSYNANVDTSTGDNNAGGTVTLTGTGGNGTDDNAGVYLYGSSITTGGGALNVTGTGGGAGSYNYGIYASYTTLDTSNYFGGIGGAITLTGTGGNGSGTNSYNRGVVLDSSTVVETGGGNFEVTGVGGDGGEGGGIALYSATVDTSNGSNTGGTVTLNGTGGNDTDYNYGVYLYDSSITTGGGALNIAGTGGGTGSENYGIYAYNTTLDSGAGPMTLTGIGAAGAEGLYFDSNTVIGGSTLVGDSTVYQLGDITLIAGGSGANSIAIVDNYCSGECPPIIQGSGTLTLQPQNPISTIGLAGSAGEFNLDSDALSTIQGFSEIVIGHPQGIGFIDEGEGNWSVPSTSLTLRNPGLNSEGMRLGSLEVSGNLTLNTTGLVTQSSGTGITAAGLELLGAGGYYLLTGNNNVVTLAGNTSGVAFNNGDYDIAIGTVNVTTGLTAADFVAVNAASVDQTYGGIVAGNVISINGVPTYCSAGVYCWMGNAADNTWDTGGNWDYGGGSTPTAAVAAPGSEDTVRLISADSSPPTISIYGSEVGSVVSNANLTPINSLTINGDSKLLGTVAIGPGEPLTIPTATVSIANLNLDVESGTNLISGGTTGSLEVIRGFSGPLSSLNSNFYNLSLTNLGDLTIDSPLTAANNLRLSAINGTLTISAPVTAESGSSSSVTIRTGGGGLVQYAAINAPNLELLGASANYSLDDVYGGSPTNTTIAGNVGSLSFSKNQYGGDITVGNVNNTNGITAVGDVTLTATYGGSINYSGSIIFDHGAFTGINSQAGTVRLFADDAVVTAASGTNVVADGLVIVAGDGIGTLANPITTSVNRLNLWNSGNSGTSDIGIANSGKALTIEDFDQIGSEYYTCCGSYGIYNGATGGQVAVSNDSHVLLNGDYGDSGIYADGDISLTASLTTTGATSDIRIGGGVQAIESANGSAILNISGDFYNAAGASALSTGTGGRWEIWVANPTKLNLGGLTEDFRQYKATYGVTTPDPWGDGLNGLLFSDQGTIAPTIGGTTTKVYDGTAAATGITLSGSSAYGDSIVSSDPFNYLNKNVGSGKAIDPASVLLNVANNGVPVYDNTLILPAGGDITPAPLTVTALSNTKVYDTTTSTSAMPVITTGTLFGTDTAVLAETYSNKNVGMGKTLTPTATINDGNSGVNYSISYVQNAGGVITPASLTVSGITAANKVYDASAAAMVSTAGAVYTGLLGSDAVTVSASGTFADKNVGTGKTVALSSSYSGTDVGNYSITDQASTSANITPAALSISGITAANKVYDATAAATVSTAGAVYTGLLGSDAVTVSASGTFTDKNVGTGKTVALSSSYSGADVGNYSITDQASTSANITPAALSISGITAANKVYDATTAAMVSTAGAVYTGLLGSDAVTVSASGTFADKNVGTGKTVALSSSYSGADVGNYSITDQASTSANITPAALSISGITAANKVYDATTAATVSTAGAVYMGLLGGDAVTVSASGTFADKNVGNGKTVALSSTYTGADVGNYSITDQLTTSANITQRPLSTWIGGASGNWSVASNWDALPDLSNVAAVSIPSGTTVTYDAAAGTTNLTSLTAGGLGIAGGTLNIADSLTVSSSFSQTGGTLGAFGSGSSASITQATGNLTLPAITVAKLDLSAPAGAITQSGPLAALTLITQSQGATTLDNPNNQVAGRVDMNAGGPLSLWASGDLTLGAIDAGANAVVIKAGGAILQAPGTGSSTNIIAGSADLSSIFGGASGDLAISTNTRITGALAATVGAEADFGGIRIQNTGAQPTSVTLSDNAIAGASVSFLNTGDITSTSGITLKTVTGGDLALLSNGNITWDGGSLATPSGSVLISADGSLGVTGVLSSPVDLALSSTTAINVSGSVVTAGTGTASFTAPSVALNGSVDSADDVGIIATTINLGAESSTGAAHDVILAASNITATNATVSAGHDISAAVTGDLRLNGSGFTAGNDIYVKLLGASSTLYLNDAAGLPPSFLWAQAPSTIHLNYAAQAFGGMVVDGIAVDPLTFVSSPGGSGLFYGAAKTPATAGAGLDVVYGVASGATTVPPTLFDAVMAAINSSTTSVTPPAGTLPPGEYGNGLGAQGDLSDQTVGGTEGQFGGDEEEENKTDKATGLKKKPNKSITKKLSTCS